MAIVYLRSTDGNDSDSGSTWALAKATLSAALTAAGAGGTVYVSQAHAETQSTTMTLTSPGTSASPVNVICVNDGAEPPIAVATTATISLTTAGSTVLQNWQGVCAIIYGITFNYGSGGDNCGFNAVFDLTSLNFVQCKFVFLNTSGANNVFLLGAPDTAIRAYKFTFENCTWKWSTTNDGNGAISCRAGTILIKGGGTDAAGTETSPLFLINSMTTSIRVIGMDLSAYATGNTLVSWGSLGGGNIRFENCKLGAGVALAQNPSQLEGSGDFIVCDNSGSNYKTSRYTFTGSCVEETTIVRTGGATDGTTPISWKIVTTANSKWISPFESIPLTKWNDTTGANVTVTVYGYWDNANLPKNDDIWIEVSYMGSASSPIATINTANTKADYLAANSDQGSDSSTWGGGDTTTRFAMSVTLSSPQPAMKGPIYVTVKAAKPSTTFYVDPKIVLL